MDDTRLSLRLPTMKSRGPDTGFFDLRMRGVVATLTCRRRVSWREEGNSVLMAHGWQFASYRAGSHRPLLHWSRRRPQRARSAQQSRTVLAARRTPFRVAHLHDDLAAFFIVADMLCSTPVVKPTGRTRCLSAVPRPTPTPTHSLPTRKQPTHPVPPQSPTDPKPATNICSRGGPAQARLSRPR